MEQSKDEETISSFIESQEQTNQLLNSTKLSEMNKNRPLTSAEKMRAFRQRQREKQMQGSSFNSTLPQNNLGNNDAEQSHNILNVNTDSTIIHKKPRTTSAERVRAFRQRQREKRMLENLFNISLAQNDRENNGAKQSYNLPSTSTVSTIIHKKPRITSAERARAFLQRQREKRMQENLLNISLTQNNCKNNGAEQSYNLLSISTDSIIRKKPRMTSAERARAFRQRQREKRMQENFLNISLTQNDCVINGTKQSHDIPIISTDPIICKKPRTTSAERVRAFRHRQREKRMQENSFNVVPPQTDPLELQAEHEIVVEEHKIIPTAIQADTNDIPEFETVFIDEMLTEAEQPANTNEDIMDFKEQLSRNKQLYDLRDEFTDSMDTLTRDKMFYHSQCELSQESESEIRGDLVEVQLENWQLKSEIKRLCDENCAHQIIIREKAKELENLKQMIIERDITIQTLKTYNEKIEKKIKLIQKLCK